MGNRVDFHKLLKTITNNVYYQPPNNMTISYPAIVYTRKDIEKLDANDSVYGINTAYNVTVIDKNPDSTILDELIRLKYCTFDRQFISDGLNHMSLTIYY